jgi:HAD superfamily hydrolase (TIGR01484 family)
MLAFDRFPVAAARGLRGVLFDLDDTVLDHGQLAVDTLASLYNLAAAGLTLVGVTGRPAAWGQVLLRQWPVHGMVTENGIVGLVHQGNRIQVIERLSAAERLERRAHLAQLVRDISAEFPDLQVTDDSLGRYADTSFDIAESTVVAQSTIDAATQFAQARGARVVRSSIHLHVCFDEDDKATGTLRFLQETLGISSSEALHTFAFIGDSENDAACFCAFSHTFGVANLRGRPTLTPRYLAKLPMGRGFSQIAAHILQQRSLAT